MERLINIYNRMKKWKVNGTVLALTACLVTVIMMIVFMPETQAAPTEQNWTESSDGTYKISDAAGSDVMLQLEVLNGGTYVIDGEGTNVDNVYIKFIYKEEVGTIESPAKINITLKDVNMTRTYDESLISFTTINNVVDYNVTIEGDCNLVSDISGESVTPVVAVEDVKYDLYGLYQNPAGDTVEDYLITLETIRQVSLFVGGADSEDQLSISVNDDYAYGAAIGSSEANFMADRLNELAEEEVEVAYQMTSEVFGSNTVKSLNAAMTQYLIELGFTPAAGTTDTFLPCFVFSGAEVLGAGKIVIGGADGSAPLRLNISNNGYGAAIGGGASKFTQIPSDIGSSILETPSADAEMVCINAGTLYISSPNADAIGSGVNYNEGRTESNVQVIDATIDGIVINGGSVYIPNAGDEGADKFSVGPVNNDGDSLVLVKGDTDAGGNTSAISDKVSSMTAGQALNLTYTYPEGFHLNESTNSVVATGAAGNILSVDMNLGNSLHYYYQGTGHESDDTLYFYLPANEAVNLKVTDNLDPDVDGEAKYKLLDSTGAEVMPEATDDRLYILLVGETYYLQPYDIPDSRRITSVEARGGEAPYNTAMSGYTINTGSEAVSMTAMVNYNENIEIVYHGGFIANDERGVVFPGTVYAYGMESLTIPTLDNLTKNMGTVRVTDLIFKGWEYTDDSSVGAVTHITRTDTGLAGQHCYKDLVNADEEIHLTATWQMQIEYVLGTGVTVQSQVPLPDPVIMDYATRNAENRYITEVVVTSALPQKENYTFIGWTVDDGSDLYNAGDTVELSTLTSHQFHPQFRLNTYTIYIEASDDIKDYANIKCVSGDSGDTDILSRTNGVLNTVVINNVEYYYSDQKVTSGTTVAISIETETGYRMVTLDVTATPVAIDLEAATGNYTFEMPIADVYVNIDGDIELIQYDIEFWDGKIPDELLWDENAFDFYYTIEDVRGNATLGDIIRRGLGVSETQMSDADIVDFVNNIAKNDRFSAFKGWEIDVDLTNKLYATSLGLKDFFDENSHLSYGDMKVTAAWTEYGKCRVNMHVLERNYADDGTYTDAESEKYTAKLYYHHDDGTQTPVYTEIEIDPETGEEMEIAYVSPGDRLYIEVYEMDENGDPVGNPVTEGFVAEELYYTYDSIYDEWVRADVYGDMSSFVVKDEVKDGTIIDAYLVYAVQKYKIIYWELHGHDNSMNPTEFTIYDEFEFVPLVEGVDWLLVCPDEDTGNYDDVKTEVITGVGLGGKPITDGVAGNRNYVSNLVLIPDWGDYVVEDDEYTITIIVDGEPYGEVTITHPFEATTYEPEDLILLSILPEEGCKVIVESLVYEKMAPATTFSLRQRAMTLEDGLQYPLQAINEEDGIYLFTMPASDVIVYATFEMCEYNITYEEVTPDMENENPPTYNITSDFELKDVTLDGYTFDGWYDVEGNKVEKIADRTGDITLTAKFTPIPTANPEPEEPEKPNVEPQKIEITGRPSNVIVSGAISSTLKTGDETNIPKLVLICVAAVLLLFIVILKRPKKDDEDEQTDGIDGNVGNSGMTQ